MLMSLYRVITRTPRPMAVPLLCPKSGMDCWLALFRAWGGEQALKIDFQVFLINPTRHWAERIRRGVTKVECIPGHHLLPSQKKLLTRLGETRHGR